MVRRFGLPLIYGCCFLWLVGCQASRSAQSSPLAAKSPVCQETCADTVELYLAFVERPVGDPYLNKNGTECDASLWTSTDQHVGGFDRQISLEENGYRVGQIVGFVPARLLTLLRSEAACVNPRLIPLQCGEPATIHTGPVWRLGAFQVKLAGQSQQIALDDAQFGFEVAASLTRDGRTKLEFTPRVEHRPSAFPVEPSADLLSYVRQTSKPYRSFPQLGWQVSLKPGETLVVGANLDRPGSLGFRSFVQEGGANPVQRVLVLRTSRPVEEG